jgi:hypothetical protein
VHFLGRNRALVADSKTERETAAANLMSSDNNSCDEQARVTAVMVGPAADAAYFTTEKALLDIGKIFYIAS